MGNTRIQDSATGNIMGLNPGFIPVGLKEHGGIMYIASVNKDGQGEIGTIPSPIIRDIYKDKVSLSFKDTYIPIDSGDPIQITNKLYPADKFIANLQMRIDPNDLKGILHTKNSGLSGPDGDPCDIVLERQICNGFRPSGTAIPMSLYSPVISYSVNSADYVQIDGSKSINIRKKGIYKLNLYSSPEQGKSILASDSLLSSQAYGPNGENKSQYWFLHTDSPTSVFPKDLFNATLNKDLKQVPVSNKPGKLAVELIPESITDFGILPRADKLFVPITYKTDEGKYHTYFPGFYYTSDSGLYVEKLTARVIDESTNSKVDLVYPYERQEIPLFNKYDLSDLSYDTSNDDYTDLFLNGGLKLWNVTDTSGLPHSRSLVDSNTQILSPIAGLFNHTKTSFKSSTQGKDDSPHSGVFYADLGDKYQNWYRLEVDYEDQYGGNKGTFTTRFNPYINDMFGTNLSVRNAAFADALCLPKPSNVSINSRAKLITPQGAVRHFIDVNYEKSFFADIDNGDWADGSDPLYVETFYGPDYTFDLQNNNYQTYQYNRVGKTLDKNYYYLAPQSEFQTITSADQQPLFMPNSELNSWYIYRGGVDSMTKCALGGNKNIDTKWMADKTWQRRAYDTNVGTIVMRSIIYNDTGTTWVDNLSIEYLQDENAWVMAKDDTDDINFDHRKKLDNCENFQIEAAIKDGQVILNPSLDAIQVRFGPLYKYQTRDLVSNAGDLSNNKSSAIRFAYKGTTTYRIHASLNVTDSEFDIQDLYSASLSYSIIPHFCLTGIAEKGNPTYVQRFGKLQDTDIVYEHNFESNENGVINYIKQLNQQQETTSPCSYNEQKPFKYLKDGFTFEESRDAGIYVLNIQRCPGVGNWTQKGTDTALINLDISIGENNIYSYNPAGGDNTIQNWSVNVSDTNKCTYKTTHGETSNMRIYTPIVLVIPNNSNVKIVIEPTDNHNFNRQSIGLYKIRDVGQDDIANELKLQESVYLYHDYMKLIQNKSASLDTVKQYAFIQKYGVFFKEAFVFVDGLYKDGQVNPITIGNKTYQPYPYIPSDPSILPVNLGEDYNYYWNTYYMPEEVLTSDDCEFIFSNDSDDYLSHIIGAGSKSVKSGKLRQLINQE